MKCSVRQIAEWVGGTVDGDGEKMIHGVLPFDDAGPEEITCAADARFLKRLGQCRAGAVLVPTGSVPERHDCIRVDNPYLAFAKVMALFHDRPRRGEGIHPGAHVGETFLCGSEPTIGPGVVIGHNVVCGHRVTLHPNVVLGDGVVMGDDVVIHPNVSVGHRCRLGNRVVIHAGTVIGSDGFGFARDGRRYFKIPQTGIVQIDDDVEIGAGNAIDRATFGKTWIQRGVKTDNLVHVAHNVVVGEDTVLVAQVGISGSVTIGKGAVLAGQAGISGHLVIGDGATVGPQAGVAKSVPDGQVVSGSPEMPHKLWLKVVQLVRRLPEIQKKVLEMEKRISFLEDKLHGNRV